MPHLVADAGLLDFNGTFFAELIAFILMIILLGKYAYPRIIRMAEAREKQIEAGVRAAQESEQRLAHVQEQVAKTLDEAKEQAREIVARAHREATAEAEEVRIKGRTDAEAVVQQAQTEIRAERDRAMQDLRSQLANLVVEATSIVVAQTLDGKAHQRLIDDALTRVEAGNGAGRDA